MKNREQWSPTKYVQGSRGLRASRDPKMVGRSSRFLVDILAPYYQRAIAAHARGRLLDVGCGHVPLYGTYRDFVSENICIDWENTLHANPYLDHVLDLSTDLPFESGSFDTILLTDVLEHVPEPARVMAEIARLLRSQGKLILGVPFLYGLHEEPHDYYRYTEFALDRFCQQNGLRVITLEQYGGAPEVLFDLTAKCLDLLRPPLSSVLRPVHTLASHLCRTWPCRNLSNASKAAFPMGYVLVAEKHP